MPWKEKTKLPTRKLALTDKEKSTNKRAKNTEEKQRVEEESKLNGFDFLRLGESYTSLILGIIVVVIATVLLLSYVHGKNTNGINSTPQEALSEHTVHSQTKIAQANNHAPLKIAPTIKIKPSPTVVTKKLAFAVKPSNIPTVQSTNVRMVKHTSKTKQQDYIIQKGDSLWSIAQKEYNNGYDWVKIAQANNMDNPGTIFSGNKLIIPTIVQQNSTNNIAKANGNMLASAKNNNTDPISTNTSVNAITGTSYTIVKGDNLWTIAVRAYGDGYQWVKIARANNLNNPELINSGNILVIPRG